MGTTRIKVIDLSSQEQEIKTSRKHARLASLAKRAEKLSARALIKEEKKPKGEKSPEAKPSKESPKKTEEQKPQATTPPSAPKTTSAPKAPAPLPTSRKILHHRGKKYQTALALIDKSRAYPAQEALDLLANLKVTKFDPTVEVHLTLTDKNLHGTVNFPHPISEKKERRYLIFADKNKIAQDIWGPHAKHGVLIIWGNEKTIEEIATGKLKPNRDFDAVVAQPAFMPSLAKIAKILGPAGLMPNPKNGTITDNPTDFIKNYKSLGLEFKTDPTAPIIHTKIGKLSAKPAALSQNLKALIAAIGPAKVKKAVIKSTMSPGIKLDLSSIATYAP